MPLNDSKHIREVKIKLSDRPYDWGYLTLCGERVTYAPEAPRAQSCLKCLKNYITKQKQELQRLEWQFATRKNEEAFSAR
jgi:hypothetical protein